MIESAVAQHLVDSAAVAAEVGGRVHPLIIPQSTRGEQAQPCLVYQVINRARGKGYCGTDATVRTTLQIDAYGRSYAAAKAASEACIAALLDFRGAMGSVLVHDVSLSAEIDLDDPEPGLYRVSNTFEIWHSPR